MKARTGFVSNSSSTSYVIAIKDPPEILSEIFSQDPGYYEDLCESEEINKKFKKFTEEGYTFFSVSIPYGEGSDKLIHFIEKIKEEEIKNARLVYKSE
jgi:hypothetical protein